MEDNLMFELLSWLAVSVGVLANIPQIVRIARKHSAKDLSLTTNLLWCFVILIMFLRASLVVLDGVFIVSNGLQLFILLVLVGFILKYRRR